jgi:tetratricopeptide (TPR) repeat protein
VESDRVIVGRPAPWNLKLLQRTSALPMEKLLAVDQSSPEYNERDRTSIFYAQSWALVHYLMHGDKGVHRRRLAAYLDLIATRPLSPAQILAVMATVHGIAGRPAEARTEAEEALRLDPGLSQAWQVLARVHAREDHAEEALRAAREAVRADPDRRWRATCSPARPSPRVTPTPRRRSSRARSRSTTPSPSAR